MSLSIKSEEAEQLARDLASATGESLTRAVTVALRERLARLRDRSDAETEARATLLRKISTDSGPRWAEAYRHADHGELLYDERGLPR